MGTPKKGKSPRGKKNKHHTVQDKNRGVQDKNRAVHSIQFDIFKNTEIHPPESALSAFARMNDDDIKNVSLLFENQEPKRGGLIDPRMGGCGDTICAMCQIGATYCNGHIGHIRYY